MKRIGTIFLVTMMLAGFAGFVFAHGTSEKTNPIKLGAVWPLGDITGAEMNNAAQLAVDEINTAGGLLGGRRIQLLVEDDQSLPEQATSAVTKLITQDRVIAVLGEVASRRSLAAAPVAHPALQTRT